MSSFDIPMVDDLLLNSISSTIPDLGNFDIDKLDASDIDCEIKTSNTSCEVSAVVTTCLLYTSPSPRDQRGSRMPSSA